MSLKDRVTKDMEKINGWNIGAVMLTVLFSAILDDEKMDVLETAVS